MKRTNIFAFTLIFGALIVLGAVKASAQAGVAPSGQFGIGTVVGTGVAASGQYAFSPSFLAGIGLGIDGRSVSGASTTDYVTDFFGRFIFEGTVNPIVQAGFRHTSTDVTANSVTVTTTANQIYGSAGLQYFINRNVGVYGLVEILTITLDPSETDYGFRNPRLGLEWYFDK